MPEAIDIAGRTSALLSVLIFAGVVLAAGRNRPAALPASLFGLAVAAFVITSTPGVHDSLGFWAWPLTALCVTKAAWFWLFARALFREHAPLGRRQLAAVGTVALVGTWQQLVFLEAYRAGTATPVETLLGFGFDAALLAFVLLALGEAARGLHGDLVEKRRRMRIAFTAATGAYLAVSLAVQSCNLLFDTNTAPLVSRANMALIALAGLGAAWLLVEVRGASWLEPAREPRYRPLTGEERALLGRLEQAFRTERIYLEDGLTIGALAERLGTAEHVLRRVINRGTGCRNFNDFLHAWRIREACDELSRPEHARLPVLAIAMKVGYGSVGTFNRAFKARVGKTPTEFRRSRINGATISN